MRLAALGVLLLVVVIALGVFFQARFRGGTSPEDVATRYVDAVRTGDRITLFLLTRPGTDLTTQLDANVGRYRDVSSGRLSITYVPHSVAAYLMTVIVRVDGRKFDELRLEHASRRWYIVHLSE